MDIPAVSTPRSENARDFYLAYLRTPDWRKRRDRSLRLVGFKCERCGSKRDLQVHHKTYERVGAELDSDLEVLCGDCHEGHHHAEGVESHLALYVKIASDVARLEPDMLQADFMEAVKVRAARLHVPYSTEKLSLACDVVLGRRKGITLPPKMIEAVAKNPERPIGKAEAELICRQLGLTVPLRSIPKAVYSDPGERRFRADKYLAFAVVLEAVQEQARVCEELEKAKP